MKATKTDWQVCALLSIPPKLRKRAGLQDPAAMLDMAINQRAGIKQALEPNNACVVLRMVRKRLPCTGEPYSTLAEYMVWAANEYSNIQPARSNTYRRWARTCASAKERTMSNKNPDCDGEHCTHRGEVRTYPLGGGANLILCRQCVAHENQYRRERGRETGNPTNWPVQYWESLEVYGSER